MALEYISSYSNRIYLRSEDEDDPLNVTSARIAPIEDLQINVKRKQLFRNDKTGFRSRSTPSGPQREEIELKLIANATGWTSRSESPVLRPLLESALATNMVQGANLQVSSVSGHLVELAEQSSLTVGMALQFNNELRFIRSILGSRSIELNDAYSSLPIAGDVLLGCCNFAPNNLVRTFELFEFWSPDSAVQRVVSGVCANRTVIQLNSDFVNLSISGFAKKLSDSVTYDSVEVPFPSAPPISSAESSLSVPIAGHLGQALIGSSGEKLCTLVQGQIVIDNGIKNRSDEFGCYSIKGFTLGQRSVKVDITMYQRNDELSRTLYSKALKNEPTSIMLQLGVGQGNMIGIYLPAVLTPVPVFIDSESRVLWRFSEAVGTGVQDDEIFVAIA